MKLPINGGERVGWEYHDITLSRVPVYGFGIAVSGGRDNPHFMNGDPSIAISDVLKAGPAEGKLLVNDRVISANGISLENVDYSQAIHVLRECGNTVNLLIKRRALISTTGNSNNFTQQQQHQTLSINDGNNNNLIKITLSKNSKKEDLGIVLGCKIFVKEIVNRNLIVNNSDTKENHLQEGDIIQKINNTNVENLSLKEAKKLLDNCKDKLTLIVCRDLLNQNFSNENGNYINGHSRSNSAISNQLFRQQQQHQHQQPSLKWPSSNGYESSIQSPLPNTSTNINDSMTAINDNINHGPPSFTSSSIATMANSRATNGWSNQNLYVQPPTRMNDSSLMNGNDQTTRLNGHCEQLASTSHNGNTSETTVSPSAKLSHRPLPQKPSTSSVSAVCSSSSSIQLGESTTIESTNGNMMVKTNESSNPETIVDQEMNLSPKTTNDEIRYIAFQKEGSVGIRLTGGNEVGIFVTAVQPGSPAYQQGLQVADKILKANNVDMKDFTREEAVLYLLRIKDRIELYVQNCKEEYENIVAKQQGDSFHIRVHFNYDSEGKGELSFHDGDVFHVVDTLFNGVVGSWFVYRLGRNNQEIQKGSIPNKSRADELATEQRLENRSKKSNSGADDLGLTETVSSRRSNFFKRRRSARRSKSLCRDNWEDILFGDGNSKFEAYERVTLRHPGFVRPVIFFGPLADIAREKLLRDYPDKFECPQSMMNGSKSEQVVKNSKLSNNSGIFRLSAIKEIIERGKHALLDITPSAVDRLNYAQFYPIVIFMRVENKSIVKELRNRSSTKNTVHRSSRKLFEQSIKLEKLWHHVFTTSITLTSGGGDLWYKKLREIIDKQQTQTVWMSAFKPDESISDDFLFPMNSISRLSYASSPESDLDISINDGKTDDDDDEDVNKKDEDDGFSTSVTGNRLAKASSDPSLAKIDTTETLVSRTNVDETKSSAENQSTMTNQNDQQSSSPSTNKQIPLHLLLKKELTKNNSFQKRVEQQQNDNIPITEYPTLKLGDTPSSSSMNRATVDESPLPPPPLPPPLSQPANSVKLAAVEIPPRIDRNSKPSRFRSAHERLFGSTNSSKYPSTTTTTQVAAPPPPRPITSIHSHSNSIHQYQTDDSDYINTTVFEYAMDKPVGQSVDQNVMVPRTTNGSITNDQSHKFNRSMPVPPKPDSLERTKKVPPLPVQNGKTEYLQGAATKTPPSPPPKPKLNNHSLSYQMNSMTLNDNNRQQSYVMYDRNHPQGYGDYDNMPSLYPPLKVPPKRVMNTMTANPMEISNGPPGYYQSLPQSSYHHHHGYQTSKDHAIHQRYSSHAETISNFINGTTTYHNNNNNNDFTIKDRNAYIDSMQGVKATKVPVHMDPSANHYNHSQPNYDNLCYPSSSGLYMNSGANYMPPPPPPPPLPQQSNDNTYLNFPFNVSRSTLDGNAVGGYDLHHHGLMNDMNGQNGSPLPPPPPLPTYSRSNNPTPNIVQPIAQQARQSGIYLDLSSNRENRGSAFELYQRKPLETSSARISTTPGSPMFHGLPPPPPLLPVNDFNQTNMYTNIDEIQSSQISINKNGKSMGQSSSNVIATARGIFGCEGGSLVSAETGVSIIIPPYAIPEGITQEIYFKVCEDNKLAPPLDRNLGETLLSPTVMCGPHGLRFNIPIELRLPHCAIVNPESWSFALKSSDINNGEPTGWRNISLNNDEGDRINGNNFNEQFVSVLVDHF
ncbi:zonula occludens-like protein polychaetoid isoform X2 [Dermatophagoides pteronyssinus]|uniref:zonula occludens-like protein polychaetoid isoform X2 n=1 Tax=Dermatophagoides pteronyssinus TaxID=6956 RepID=UPI003F672BC6